MILRVFRMMAEFRIDLPETLQFHDADFDQDGILLLDLRTARVSERALAFKRRSAASTTASSSV